MKSGPDLSWKPYNGRWRDCPWARAHLVAVQGHHSARLRGHEDGVYRPLKYRPSEAIRGAGMAVSTTSEYAQSATMVALQRAGLRAPSDPQRESKEIALQKASSGAKSTRYRPVT